MTRLVVLPNYNKIIMGRDLNGIFKPGMIYEATEIMGEIILREVGETCSPKRDRRKFSQVMTNGRYLFTTAEKEKMIKIEAEEIDPDKLKFIWGDGSDE